ncbi:ABC transporter substrate-binding protein [Comamonadaceae bacterium G21597-S1]|nr:ABC transporter substrate-binding protein [Comamonadaceae bacterium G21597-S1]
MFTIDRRRLIQSSAALSAGSIFGIPLDIAAQSAKGGVLVIGGTQAPRHLNPAVQSGSASMSPGAQIFASPILMDKNWKPQPYLAERWTLSPDNRSVTLHLRKDAVFHDGKPVTAEDVKFSIETIRDNHPFKSMYGTVNAVTISDPHTAVVRLSEPHPALLLAMSTSLTPIIPKHIYGDGTDVKIHPRNASPVGSGPFRLVEFKQGQHVIMQRFDRFFLPGQPNLDRVILRLFKDTGSLLLAFERGELDLLQSLSDAREIERVRKVPAVQVIKGAAPAIGPLVWLAFNTKSPKLADKRVRQAINFAIDKKHIIDILLGGINVRSTGPIASGSPFYSAEVERYDLNLAKAAQLLDAAGLKPGANGVRLSLNLDAVPGVGDMRTIQEYLKPSLVKAGIEINLRYSPDFPSWARRVSTHDFDLTLDSVNNWGDPVIGVHRTWLSSNIRPGVVWSNTQSYSNPKVDEWLTAAGQEMNLLKRKELYKQFQKTVVDDCPVAFLFEQTYYGIAQGKVANPPAGIWGHVEVILDTAIKA